MSLPTDDLGWLTWLRIMHETDLPHLREYNALYEGTAPLHYIHPEILRLLDGRLQAVSLGWPSIAVDPLHERLELTGFRYSDDGDDVDEPDADLAEAAVPADENLRRVWADNNLAQEFPMGLLDALVMKRSYLCVGTNEDDPDVPLVTVESPLEVFAEVDPRTRRVRAAMRRWCENEALQVRLPEEYATLYLPERTVWYDRGPSGWRETGRDEHNLGVVPVVPMVNRGRLSARYGRSELTPALISLSHAANKIASDMMVGAEFHAMPLRAVFGIGPDDMVDERGNKMTIMQALMGRLLTVPTDEAGEVKPYEWPASSLDNFHGTLNQLARAAAGLLGYDAHEFGFATDNPASAEALRARESRAVRRAEVKITGLSGAPKRAMQLVRRLQESDWDPRAKRLECIWREPSTPTKAAAADAAMKLFTTSPEPIVPLRQTREDLGYNDEQIKLMEDEDAKTAAADPLEQIARGMADNPGAGPAEPVNAGGSAA